MQHAFFIKKPFKMIKKFCNFPFLGLILWKVCHTIGKVTQKGGLVC